MNIFKKAEIREKKGYGYNYSKRKVIWQSNKTGWNWFAVNYGIRRSDIIQILPIWFTGNNSQNSFLIGFWKLYIEFIYHKK